MNHSLIQSSFDCTVKILFFIVAKTKIPYRALNILIWYVILPAFWLFLISPISSIIYLFGWFLALRVNFHKKCDKLFYKSQKIILFFGDYTLWSVIICLIVPLIITVILLAHH